MRGVNWWQDFPDRNSFWEWLILFRRWLLPRYTAAIPAHPPCWGRRYPSKMGSIFFSSLSSAPLTASRRDSPKPHSDVQYLWFPWWCRRDIWWGQFVCRKMPRSVGSLAQPGSRGRTLLLGWRSASRWKWCWVNPWQDPAWRAHFQ